MTFMVQVYAPYQVQPFFASYLSENKSMIEVGEETKSSNGQRLEAIGRLLIEIRFSEGRNQDEFAEWGASRRQIQRGEYGSDLRLSSLFNLLDCYGYTLQEFFADMV